MRRDGIAETTGLDACPQSGGDLAAVLETLFRRYHGDVFALVYRLTGHRAEAEDIAQTTFVKAARGLAGFRGEAAHRSWLYRIAVNTVAEVRARDTKRLKAIRGYDVDRIDACDANNSPGVGDDESARLWAALAELPYRHRVAIVLAVCESMSHRDVATVLGCAEATVSWYVHRAKRKLCHLLRQDTDHG